MKVAVLSLLSFLTTLLSACDHQKQLGPLKLETPKLPKIGISEQSTHATVSEYPAKIEATISYRFRYTAFCTTNFWDDMDCIINITSSFPTNSEVQEWKKQGYCKVGPYCGSQWQCYGEAANRCQDQEPSMTERGRENFLFAGPPLPTKLSKQCTQDWRCGFKTLQMPISLQANGRKTDIYTSDEKGAQILLDGQSLLNGYSKDNDYKITFENVGMKPKIWNVEAQCISGNPNDIICFVNDDPNLKRINRIPITIDPKTGKGVLRNYQITLVGSIETVVDGKIQTIVFNTDTEDDTLKINKESDASIEDILEMISAIKATQLQSLYNTIQLHDEIFTIQEIYTKTLKSVSKIDDHLIGEVMGVRGKTKWFNEEIFYIHPCDRRINTEGPNCQRGMKFKKGRWGDVKGKEDHGDCTNVIPNQTQKVNVFRKNSLDVTQINMLSPETASNEWDGWSWIASVTSKYENISQESIMKGSTEWELVTNRLFGPVEVVSQWFNRLSSLVGWLALILTLLRR